MLLQKVKKDECPELLAFILEIASYEKLRHEVVADVETLQISLFGEFPRAHAFFVCCDGERVGFLVYYFSFSTFSGRPTLYVEDVFVRPEHRKKGLGSSVWRELEEIARRENCSGMHWNVLNWNQPAIQFYLKQGAKPLSDWTMYKIKF